MKYNIDNLSVDDMNLIGVALDALPHGRVQALVAKVQAQIGVQEAAERRRIEDEQQAAIKAWRDGERDKLRAELGKSRKRGR